MVIPFLFRCSLGPQQGDLGLERLEGVERAVDRRKTQVGHLVELPQRRQDRHANLMGLDLGHSAGAHRLLDALGQQGQIVLGDRAALARLANARQHLVAGERLAGTRTTGHRQARGLDGREAPAALGALPTPPDRGAVVGRTASTNRRSVRQQSGQCTVIRSGRRVAPMPALAGREASKVSRVRTPTSAGGSSPFVGL
jgi:hypothetical protein